MVSSNDTTHFECSICMEVLHDAVEISCCNTLFCSECAKVDSCPSCRSSAFKLNPCLPIRRIIGNLSVTCCMCDYATTRSEYAAHYRQCPSRVKRCNLCDAFVPITESELIQHAVEHHSKDVVNKFFS
ncbi:hypothetical protein P9112_013190 [Eukaryota sp. TZLM1-RC]